MLYELQEQIKLLTVRKNSIIDQIKMLKYRMENIGAIRLDKVSVMGRGTPTTIDDIIASKTTLEFELDLINEHLIILEKELSQLCSTLTEFSDRDMLIYQHSKIKDWTSVKIGVKFGLSGGRIREIICKIDKKSDKFKLLFKGVEQ